MSQEGLDKLKKELAEALAQRPVISAAIAEAREKGDLSENAEYDSAKDEQAELEERIVKLENMIRTAKIIDENDMSNDFVGVGLKVEIKDVDSGEKMEFTIVGSTEADPFAGKISNESLVGQHLLGKKKGEVVEIVVPDGVLHYKVENISR